MLFLIFITFLGALASFTAHILLLFHVKIPSGDVSIALNIGLISVFLRIYMTRNLREGNDLFLDSSVKRICPHRLKIITTIAFVYGAFTSGINLIGSFSKVSRTMTEADYIVASRRLFIAVFSLLFACYSLEFMLNYSFRLLKKEEVENTYNLERYLV